MKRVRGSEEGRNNLLGGCDILSEEFCSIRWENGSKETHLSSSLAWTSEKGGG